MNGVKVEVDLAELIIGVSPHDGEPIDLLSVVLNRVADRLIAEVKTGRDVYPALQDRVSQIRDEEIREAIRPAISDALTASVQPTNSYGQPKGEPLTLHEVIVNQAAQWLKTPKPKGYDKPQTTPVQDFIRAEVEGAIAKELRQVVEQAKADVLAAVRTEGAKVLTETIARMGGVR